ncbi:MAG: Bug family tripartite tricarboxylate transporter substrate binding protein [Burkholderiales bacterium]
MHWLRKTWLCVAFCAAATTLFGGAAGAAESAFPTRPIRLIVASSPGGPNDLLARIVSAPWGEVLGRTIVVDNRAGAAGMIATEIAARAVPDGYTLLVGFPGPLIIGPGMSASPPYDALKDFTPISLMASGPFVLLANPGVPAKTMRELVALAKSQPGKLNYGSGGAGQSSHMAMELFKLVAGIDMVHVPYKGAGPGMTALIAGEVSVMFASIGSAIAHINSGKLRAVAVGGARRAAALPNVATIKESGFAFDAASWYGIVAPRNLPQPIVSRLQSTLTATLNAPAMQSRLTDLGFEVNASTPAQFAEHLRSETAVWNKVIAATGMRQR